MTQILMIVFYKFYVLSKKNCRIIKIAKNEQFLYNFF